MNYTIKPKNNLNGTITVAGDKSISHRSIMLGAIAKGVTKVSGFLTGEDCLSTISCFRKMGIKIDVDGTNVTVYGNGIRGLSAPTEILDVGNSGTTMRLLTGLLSGQDFSANMTGDSSIQKRPMDRVSIPISQMGGEITGTVRDGKLYAPLTIHGKPLNSIEYTLPVASAQVKSAIILASLLTEGETVITEPEPTRDHTEIMLNYLGANIRKEGTKIICPPVKELYGKDITVPADISSAAFFMVLGLICPNSEITLENVGVNPTRTGIITVLKNMGGNLELKNERTLCGEKVADIVIKTSSLNGTTVEGAIIPTLIDEIPVIAVAAVFAQGTTIIKDAQELKVKESNRIKTIVCELKKMGANIEETEDGMIIQGGTPLNGATCQSYDDHRIAMSLAIAATCASSETTILDTECVDISFPNFFDYLERL